MGERCINADTKTKINSRKRFKCEHETINVLEKIQRNIYIIMTEEGFSKEETNLKIIKEITDRPDYLKCQCSCTSNQNNTLKTFT